MKSKDKAISRQKDFDSRLSALEDQLADRQKKETKKQNHKSDNSGYGNALKMSSEFISAILVGAAIGYAFDALIGTSPWGMIVLLLLGFVAGVLNVLRSSGAMSDPYVTGGALKSEETKKSDDKTDENLFFNQSGNDKERN